MGITRSSKAMAIILTGRLSCGFQEVESMKRLYYLRFCARQLEKDNSEFIRRWRHIKPTRVSNQILNQRVSLSFVCFELLVLLLIREDGRQSVHCYLH